MEFAGPLIKEQNQTQFKARAQLPIGHNLLSHSKNVSEHQAVCGDRWRTDILGVPVGKQNFSAADVTLK
ncbi:hypothetical protein THTE_2223 [Thermogutta terrifontis]|jgi:hypothetical protein|uniref:Uncharacterized protein n=1 Tax=Thermogutta terrifontis TaxID=1331910 RepID=A0A286RFU2_9BACT|nr:hypothetical protein THTE_2223 [Thermogutta terrifontis]